MCDIKSVLNKSHFKGRLTRGFRFGKRKSNICFIVYGLLLKLNIILDLYFKFGQKYNPK